MKERCPSCGNELYPNSKYCGNCGKEIKRDNKLPVINETNNQEVIINNNEQTNNYKEPSNNKDSESLKTVSLVFGLLGLFFSFILSVVGLITGIAYKSKTKNTCAGLVISIISIVFRLLIVLFATLLVASIGSEFANEMEQELKNGYEYNEQYNNNYNEDNNYKAQDNETQTIGNAQYGYVKVPKDWIKFYDPDAKDTVQYTYMMTYIITLYAYDSSITDPYLVASNLKYNEEKNGLSVTMTPTTIDKYNAYKLDYIVDGTWLNIYFFKAEDNKVHYLCIEGPDKYSEYFNIPKTFKLTNTEV